jgi:hypothetical protein
MATTKRRKAMGADPLADAATGAAPSTPAPPPPGIDEGLPQPVDAHVPPAPPLRPVPRRGAFDPNDRVRTLIVGLLLALLLALGAQQWNRTAQLKSDLADAIARAGSADAEHERAESLAALLARAEKRLDMKELEAAESAAEERLLEQALTELSRATASAGQWSALASALSAVHRDLGFAQRWPAAERPAIAAELERGDVLRLGRPATSEEISALRGQVDGGTLQALADASDGLRPWRALGPDDRLDAHPTIPERGLMLMVLLDAGVSAGDLAAIPFEASSLRRQGLGRADLSGVDLNRADLRGADLSRCTLNGTVLTGAIYDAATAWPPGFDVAASGARAVQE